MRDELELNRRHWDEATAIHTRDNNYGIEDFKGGLCRLHRLEVEEVGNVRDKRLLHLRRAAGTFLGKRCWCTRTPSRRRRSMAFGQHPSPKVARARRNERALPLSDAGTRPVPTGPRPVGTETTHHLGPDRLIGAARKAARRTHDRDGAPPVELRAAILACRWHQPIWTASLRWHKLSQCGPATSDYEAAQAVE